MNDAPAETISLLLKELNKRREHDGKPPLSKYPESACTSCGEIPAVGVPVFQSQVPYIRTCQNCVLREYPFSKLRLADGEIIRWYKSNPTFHRSTDYGIVITDKALYCYSPLRVLYFVWKRIPLKDIKNAEFHDSYIFPALHVYASGSRFVLRTPWDYADEMEYDRKNLKEAAERIRAISVAAI